MNSEYCEMRVCVIALEEHEQYNGLRTMGTC